MNNYPSLDDLNVFITIVKHDSFTKAANELNSSQAYVSKRLNILEKQIKKKLIHRDARKVILTEVGEITHDWAVDILSQADDFLATLNSSSVPLGKLKICSTFGIGRVHVANALSLIQKKYPSLSVSLDLLEDNIDIVDQKYDMEIRVGYTLPENRIAKLLCKNQRILCASPEYLEKHPDINTLDDLSKHCCIIVNEKDSTTTSWQLESEDNQRIKVILNNYILSNSSEVATRWAIQGHGIVLRSMWDAKHLIDDGKLVQILKNYTQNADIYAIYASKTDESIKIKSTLEVLEQYFSQLPEETSY